MTKFVEERFSVAHGATAEERDRYVLTFRDATFGDHAVGYACPKCNKLELYDLEVLRVCAACNWIGRRHDV